MTFQESINQIDAHLNRLILEIDRLGASNAELLAAAKGIIKTSVWSPNRDTSCDDDALRMLQAAIANAEESA